MGIQTLTLLGTQPVPLEVKAAVSYRSGRKGTFNVVGNIAAEWAQALKKKFNVWLNPDFGLVLADQGYDHNWAEYYDVTVSLEPFDVRAGVDVEAAVVVAVFDAMFGASALCGQLIFVGEVGLDGEIQPLQNVLAYAAKGGKGNLVLPENSSEEVTLCGIRSFLIKSLLDLQNLIGIGTEPMPELFLRNPGKGNLRVQPPQCPDMSEVKAQAEAKWALEVAAAGRHNVLMVGPPGIGKSFLAKTLPGILPPLNIRQALETTAIWRMRDDIVSPTGIVGVPPIRKIDKNTSLAALKGGGHQRPLPGELSLAHNGVLYADELHQVSRPLLEELRTPLEDGIITISRSKWTAALDCNFIFVASTNPCPCGHSTHPGISCTCTNAQRQRHNYKLSGPLLDRIPIKINLPPLTAEDYRNPPPCDSSKDVRQRVIAARQRAKVRGWETNSEIPPDVISSMDCFDSEAVAFEDSIVDGLNLSVRARDDLRRLCLTVVDLQEKESVGVKEVESALQILRGDLQ